MTARPRPDGICPDRIRPDAPLTARRAGAGPPTGALRLPRRPAGPLADAAPTDPRLTPSVETVAYDGSFDGWLTAVFDAYRRNERPARIVPAGATALDGLFAPGREVATDPGAAARVRSGLARRLGDDGVERLYVAFLSEAAGIEDDLFSIAARVFAGEDGVLDDLRDASVLRAVRLAARVRNEVHRMHAFVRFERCAVPSPGVPSPDVLPPDDSSADVPGEPGEGASGSDGDSALAPPRAARPARGAPFAEAAGRDAGAPRPGATEPGASGPDVAAPVPGELWLARVAPDFHVLPLLAPHFTGRYGSQPWAIADTRRGLALVHTPGAPLAVTFADALLDLPRVPDEASFQRMWRRYIASVNIPERRNLRLQRRHLPRRYWPYLTEWADGPA